jgi:hypothetical protein
LAHEADRRGRDTTWHLFDRSAREPAPAEPIVAEELSDDDARPREVAASRYR